MDKLLRDAWYNILVYTKTVDSVFGALWLATQLVIILHDSPPVPPSERRQTHVLKHRRPKLTLRGKGVM